MDVALLPEVYSQNGGRHIYCLEQQVTRIFHTR